MTTICPAIKIIDAIKIDVYSREHPPPHFHAIYAEYEELIESGLTQEQLARRSGTTRFYISRIENNKTDIEMSTFRKIIEAGLGKNLRFSIE